ncbi:hypothetical protein BH23BAC1_BH23BAC1_43210 [soil metagenome]
MSVTERILIIALALIGNILFYLMYNILKKSQFKASYFINYFLTISNFIKLINHTPGGDKKKKYLFVFSSFVICSIAFLLVILQALL